MAEEDDDRDDALSDADLLDREADHRDDFLRREQAEPQLRTSSWRSLHGSQALIRAWERWRATSVAARLRGLIARGRRR